MLTDIHIRDFAIIDTLALELERGLSVITGETGAGKSILVDALGFVLGERSSPDVIRHGCTQAEVNAEFVLDDAPAAAIWLADNDLADGDHCLLRRVLSRDGRSRGYINGRPAPMRQLKALGEFLIDIHGQHEHQSLLRRDAQMALLDAFGNSQDARREVADCHTQWKQAAEKLDILQAANDDRSARLDLLRYQVQELDALALEPDEPAALDDEHARLAHAGRLIEGSQQALLTLYDNEQHAAYSLLAGVEQDLRALTELDGELGPIADTIASAAVNANEAADSLRRHLDGLDIDPARLEWVENRIASIRDLARKHHVEPDALPEVLTQLHAELDALDHSEETLEALAREVEHNRNAYHDAAHALHQTRAEAADTLNRDITAAMQTLGMEGGQFAIAVDWQPEAAPAAHGLDRIAFNVSANPGHPPQALAKVASGGELSRIALAIQVIAARAGALPSLVFDEVDSGVGGGVAEIVGQHLRGLSTGRQVFCVTHLPQVASQAHHHFHVAKGTSDGTTRTAIHALDNEARVEELARMLGGVDITATTREHAREMIANA